MNKLAYIIVAMLLLIGTGTYAQESSTGTPDANFSIYKNKLKKSNENLDDEKKSSTAKFWLSRADLMIDIFNLHRDFLRPGTQAMNVTIIYSTPDEKSDGQDEDGTAYEEWIYEKVKVKLKNGVVESFEEIEVLHEDPLAEAFKSLAKATEYDTDGKLEKKIKAAYEELNAAYKVQGGEQYTTKDYEGSHSSFAKISEINELPLMGNVVDTAYLYFAGLTATQAKLTEESIVFYNKALEYNYPEPDVYLKLKYAYFDLGDTLKGVEILENGFDLFPDNKLIVNELINYYLFAGKEKEALDYLKIAQDDDPENVLFIFVEASLYDKMGDREKALETYNRCLEIDPEYFNAYYNMGVMFYNQAVEMNNAAGEIQNAKEYGIAKAEADAVFEKSLPYIEKANAINPTDRGALETLKTLYYRTGNTEKYEEIKAQLDELPAEKSTQGFE